MKFIITGKEDTYHAVKKPSTGANKLWVSFKKYAAIQSVFDSREDVIAAVIRPAFINSGLRSGKPTNEELNKHYTYLRKEGCIVEVE